ncbi:ABC transporter substrate-binding protein [Dactylosporangium sp. CA-092794]|uniref:ABC transporter substrate-binding protein n=1 Tax=Dactylosporangium sp. CA-092794 TaxID=3239929 RepID=UPI003D938622
MLGRLLIRSGKRRTCVAVMAAAVVLLAGCSAKATNSSEKSGKGGVTQGVGVTDTSIRLGAISDLSGPFSAADSAIIKAEQVYFDKVNEGGGVCGRKIDVELADSGYDVQKATVAYSQQEPKVLAFAQIFGSAINASLNGRYRSDKVLLYPASQSGPTAQVEGVLQIGVTYDYEIINLLDYWLDKGVIKQGDTIAHIGLVGDLSNTAFAGSGHVAKQRGINVKTISVPATAVDMTAQVTNARAEGAAAILVSGTPKQVASVVAASQAAGFPVPVGIDTTGWENDLLAGSTGQAVQQRVYVGAPNADLSITDPTVQALMAAFKAADPKHADDFKQLSAFSAALAITTVLKQACDDGALTRDGLLEARKKLSSIDFHGMVPKLDLSKGGVPTTQSYVMRPDPSAPGMLKSVDGGAFAGPDAATYKPSFTVS